MATAREPSIALAKDGLRRDYTPAPQISFAYLLGVLHDATERHTTYRISSNSLDYCNLLKRGIKALGSGAWIYKEGKSRNLWIVEFPKSLLAKAKIKSKKDKIDYIRGYFDAEGGIAKSSKVRFYIYFAQKNKNDLLQVRNFIKELGISCGKMHNPSVRKDPEYWRFYISAKSYNDFARIVGSAHPIKSKLLWMKR